VCLGVKFEALPENCDGVASKRKDIITTLGQALRIHHAKLRYGLLTQNDHRHLHSLRISTKRQRYVLPNDPKSDLSRSLVQLLTQASHFTRL